ncbi:MAG: adenylate kinase [Amphiamblys sp. WSBS2006]|nr:MAG: adenylate kinase [Amphiamblys sp. WSBS2006]
MKTQIWILGAPGTGKGTLSANITKKHGIQHLCMGELLRKSRDAAIVETIRKGNLIPGKQAAELITKEMERVKGKEIILDGFPRTVEQYKMFKEVNASKVTCIIWLKCEETLAMKRIQERALQEPERNDSDPETVSARLKEYEKTTRPLLGMLHADELPCYEIDTTHKTPKEVLDLFDEVYSHC